MQKFEWYWNFDCEGQIIFFFEGQIKFNWEDVSSGTDSQKIMQDLAIGSPGG